MNGKQVVVYACVYTYTHTHIHEHEPGQTPGDGEGEGGLGCWSPWGHKESDTTGGPNNNPVL